MLAWHTQDADRVPDQYWQGTRTPIVAPPPRRSIQSQQPPSQMHLQSNANGNVIDFSSDDEESIVLLLRSDSLT